MTIEYKAKVQRKKKIIKLKTFLLETSLKMDVPSQSPLNTIICDVYVKIRNNINYTFQNTI